MTLRKASMQCFDFIVVGAGSAGCVLANRLSADPQNRVLLLEAGGEDRHPLMTMPLGFLRMFMDPKLNWGYASEPEPSADGRSLPLPRGRTLGGTSSTNGMVYARGHPLDFDDWRDAGLPGWGFADVLPYFKRSETSWRGETPFHGGSGPLAVCKQKPDKLILPRLLASARGVGLDAVDDVHGPAFEGIGVPDFTISKRGRRSSTAVAYLRSAMLRSNLTVQTRALVTRVLLDGTRAVGVEYEKDGNLQQIRAEREIILSGGSYNSPQLLLLSGIGPADELRDVGVTAVHDLPGVGRNLQEHALAGLSWDAQGAVAFESSLRFDRLAWSVIRWKLFGTGIVARLPVTAMAYYKTRPELDRPDIKGNFYPTLMDSRVWFPLIRKGRGHVFSMFNLLLRPESRGWVRLRSNNPRELARIRLNLLSEPRDVRTLREAVKMMRELHATPPLADLLAKETTPGLDVKSDEDIDAWIRKTAIIAHHPAGTCKMGNGADGVVDAQLKVRGIDGLRVADASVMPTIVGGNTNAPTIMIGEKAADMVLGRAPMAPHSWTVGRPALESY
jgi:choline dehydrogenase